MVFDRKEYNREYKKTEKYKEYMREYYKTKKGKESQQRYKKSEKGKKTIKICSWKNFGIICDDWDKLYDKFISTTHCELCNIELTQDRYNTLSTRCLDHDHSITDKQNIRNIICNLCNVKRDKGIELSKKEYLNKRYLYQKSWGGEKRYHNNLLEIDVNLFI